MPGASLSPLLCDTSPRLQRQLAVAAFFFFYADTFKMLPGQTEIGPGAFPKAVCVGLAVCGVLLIIQELRKGGSEKAELFSKKLLIGIAAAVVYFVLLKNPGACGAVCHLRYVPEGPSAQRNPFRPVGLI